MSPAVPRILLVDAPELAAALAADAHYGPFEVLPCEGLDAAAAQLAQQHVDAVVIATADAPALLRWSALSMAIGDAALVVLASPPDAGASIALVQRGAQDVIADGPSLPRAVRLALERKAAESLARKAYATDLMTGLPNQMQLLEHVNQLLALREREPAPMALLAVRIEGLSTTEARLGRESANVLRRKVAVRLRAGVRASDVVASLGGDAFALLLTAFHDPQDAQRVADKLAASLRRPFSLSGSDVAVAAAIGVARSPEDGRDAAGLLRRAQGLAVSMPAAGRVGFANRLERGTAAAANDED